MVPPLSKELGGFATTALGTLTLCQNGRIAEQTQQSSAYDEQARMVAPFGSINAMQEHTQSKKGRVL